MIDLEQMITNAYTRHLADLEAKKQERIAEEERKKQTAIAKFREVFDPVFAADLQNAMGIEFDSDSRRTFATFTYQDTKICIFRYSDDMWEVETSKGETFGAKPSEIVDRLLATMGRIREEFQPKRLTPEEALEALIFALSQSEYVYSHRFEFQNSDKFGEDLKTVVCLLQKLSDEIQPKSE
ncbi:hypothetical protein VF14_03545 [Nostoc linckia z18]|uniref:Uncharacterized protein n=2 Tax=Nostoc linckia TaxID=92942 RepID=A0A9Q5ZGK5_NOSLI|nr:hypothetical protein [Nostoc linckia]PHK41451.1 hypothetical protein VF12_06530 [Nostoc linckia z15]PHK46952.1 hypothetical protein VF13_08190 [Nostoc linckia z16]PHJ69213.1 hypothetical protein VF02_01015 [Nostoc linckia z1]PHJ73365.1 hypothetical protein VF05_02035 [Nostoc linckia z3]PHJ78712.1 hypothetical protein VF03_01020 [Nostoc linckia z2]